MAEKQQPSSTTVALEDLLYDNEDDKIEEVNTIGSGNVVGYIAPIGTAGMHKDKAREQGFWGDEAGQPVKTDSPELHKDKKKQKAKR